jgi:hypothetical protein
MILSHPDYSEPSATAETDRIERNGPDARILAEDLEDQADLERERYEAGWNAACDLLSRLVAHDGHKRLAEFLRKQRK